MDFSMNGAWSNTGGELGVGAQLGLELRQRRP